MLRRKLRGRVSLSSGDRLFFVWLYRLFPSISRVMLIVRPDTLVRWHRAGFRCYWRWKSRGRIGRPRIDYELRGLIRRMSAENPYLPWLVLVAATMLITTTWRVLLHRGPLEWALHHASTAPARLLTR